MTPRTFHDTKKPTGAQRGAGLKLALASYTDEALSELTLADVMARHDVKRPIAEKALADAKGRLG